MKPLTLEASILEKKVREFIENVAASGIEGEVGQVGVSESLEELLRKYGLDDLGLLDEAIRQQIKEQLLVVTWLRPTL